MEHMTAKANTFQSSHPSDKGSSITLVGRKYLLLNDGTDMSVIKLSAMIVLGMIGALGDKKNSVIDGVLTIKHTTKGDPYMEGLQLSVTRNVAGIYESNGVSVFLEARDVPVFTKVLVNGGKE